MPATTGIIADLSDTVTVVKKAVLPSTTPSNPTVGQLWPRGSKTSAS